MSPDPGVAAWVARAPQVPREWFRHPSKLHGVGHTQRVHIHTQRLTELMDWSADDAGLALRAALLHDIGRLHDGWEPAHGARSAARARRLGLMDDLESSAAALVVFAVEHHSRSDRRAVTTLERLSTPPGDGADDTAGLDDADAADRLDIYRARRILWLLKDADALDRVRLPRWERADPSLLRYKESVDLLPFADELFKALRP